ncbi:MAG: hypothetical protein LOY04_17835 [Rhodococcus ruber]|nr:hypothetical protein [Rhodococcus ruber]
MTALAQIPTPPVGFAGTVRYAIRARDKRDYSGSKILDICEGTQQIQQLIIARRLLGLSSAELK